MEARAHEFPDFARIHSLGILHDVHDAQVEEVVEAVIEEKVEIVETPVEEEIDFSKKMYQSFLDDEINVMLPGGGENLKMVDMRIAQPVTMFLDAVASSGHTLVVGHRNVNKMIMRNLLGLSFEEGYQVEHKHNCLYVYAPKIRQIFFTRIGNPGTIIELEPGYKKID